MRLNDRREMGGAPLRRSERRGLVMVIFLRSLKEVSFFFVSRQALHLMCQNLRHPETRPESLFPLANHRMMVISLLLMRSNKSVYSSERADIYVGEWLRLAAVEGFGNDQSGANSFPGRGATKEVLRSPACLQICYRELWLDKTVSLVC